MFVTRNNNENAVYEQQTVTAAKNQGVKALAPKTPANKAPKTPFRVPLNDENAAFGPAKTGGKGLFGGNEKAGKAERNAFVTPAGPRTRAPLGAKTTNAKATAFQTPAPPTQEKLSAKPGSPRLRRGKFTIHEPKASAAESEDDVPDIEYMPPREAPLPDHPDDWPVDRTYPQFEGNNLTKGWWSEFAPKPRDDEDEDFSDFEEKIKAVEERQRKEQEAKAKNVNPVATKTGPLTTKPPSTLRAKSAATALSSKTSTAPSSAAPTTGAKARLPSTLTSKKPTFASSTTTANPRHTAAKAASKTTLGYSKGRTMSAVARRPLQSIPKQPGPAVAEPPKPKAPTAGGLSLDQLLGFKSLAVEDDGEDAGFLSAAPSWKLFEEDEELRDFQLEVSES